VLPGVKVYAIAIQAEAGGIFNPEVLEYVAYAGGGGFYEASDTSGLATILAEAFENAACSTPTPTPTPTSTPTPTPAGSVCDGLSAGQVYFQSGRPDVVRVDLANQGTVDVHLNRVIFDWPGEADYPNMYLDWFKLGGRRIWNGNSSAHPADVMLTGYSSRRWLAAGATKVWKVDIDRNPSPFDDYFNPDQFHATFYFDVGGEMCMVESEQPPTPTPTPSALCSDFSFTGDFSVQDADQDGFSEQLSWGAAYVMDTSAGSDDPLVVALSQVHFDPIELTGGYHQDGNQTVFDVSPAPVTMWVTTQDGELFSGQVTFDSLVVDGNSAGMNPALQLNVSSITVDNLIGSAVLNDFIGQDQGILSISVQDASGSIASVIQNGGTLDVTANGTMRTAACSP